MDDWFMYHGIIRHLTQIELLVLFVLMIGHRLENRMLMEMNWLDIMLVIVMMV